MAFSSKTQKLFAVVVLSQYNIHMLHWNTIGTSFDPTHEKLGYYVDKLNEFIDSIGEILKMQGENPLSLVEVIDGLDKDTGDFNVISSTELFNDTAVWNKVNEIFSVMMACYDEAREEVPADIASEFDTQEYWLRLECRYKGLARLNTATGTAEVVKTAIAVSTTPTAESASDLPDNEGNPNDKPTDKTLQGDKVEPSTTNTATSGDQKTEGCKK